MRYCKAHITRFALMLMLILMCVGTTSALDLMPGNYFFDNSKLHFSQVKMIVGNVTLANKFTRVYDMTQITDHDWWQATIDAKVNNATYFVFAETDVASGIYDTTLSMFLDSLYEANNDHLRRTSLKSKISIDWSKSSQWIYYPINDKPLSNGYWRPDYSYNVNPSGTLPIIYLNTKDSATISSKDYYIDGSLWIDDALQQLGSKDEPLTIEVKGRGNWTWKDSDKKPYKIKFVTKQSPLGLDRSRHFVLLCHYNDFSGYLRNTMGFEMSRLLNMPYTPTQVPVELVLNGEYEGLYFLCEKIRVEGGRVDIMEQADNETIPDNVTGGWLLELTDDANTVIDQYQNNDHANPRFTIATQSPEVLSQVQRKYIHDLLARADSCVYVPDKSDQGWEQLLDINTLARFYVIHEVMENVEAFSGSLFMYKDLGWDEKLMFGPVWDFDNSFFQESTTSDHFIFDYNTQYPFLWIKEILKFPSFKLQVRKVWREFCNNHILDKIIDCAWQLRELVADAEQQDCLRWFAYASSHTPDKPQEFIDVISNKVAWLNTQWDIKGDVNMDGRVTATDLFDLYDYLLSINQSNTTKVVDGDVNRDDKITVTDVIELCEILLGNNIVKPVIGDVNGDGAVTATDLIFLYDYLFNDDQQYSSSCDIDGDGNVTATDLRVLQEILLSNGN